MTVYYVSSISGSNNNAGTSATAPLATLQAAADLVQPGDTVQVMNGTYSNPSGDGAVLQITTSGTASAPITFEAMPGQTPVIESAGNWAGIGDYGASYITVSGFTIQGDAPSVTLAEAQSQENNTNNPVTAGDGIDIEFGIRRVESAQHHHRGQHRPRSTGRRYCFHGCRLCADPE